MKKIIVTTYFTRIFPNRRRHPNIDNSIFIFDKPMLSSYLASVLLVLVSFRFQVLRDEGKYRQFCRLIHYQPSLILRLFDFC